MSRPTWTESELAEAVKSSGNASQTLTALGLRPKGGNYDVLKRNIARLGLNTDHWSSNNRTAGWRKPRPLEEILTVDSDYSDTTTLKSRLIKNGLLEWVCASCGLTEWLGMTAPLELDHKNGVRSDNRLENLRLLCPNCHALTDTFRGRNNTGLASDGAMVSSIPRKGEIVALVKQETICKCGAKVSAVGNSCRSCAAQAVAKKQERIDWPSVEELKVLVEQVGYSAAGRKLGVSDNAIRNRIKRHS